MNVSKKINAQASQVFSETSHILDKNSCAHTHTLLKPAIFFNDTGQR